MSIQWRRFLFFFLLVGCAGDPFTRDLEIAESFPARRPAMVVIEVTAPEDLRVPLGEALYRGLLEKNYAVAVIGARPGTEGGVLRAFVGSEGAVLELLDAAGAVLFHHRISGGSREAEELAQALLEPLPPK